MITAINADAMIGEIQFDFVRAAFYIRKLIQVLSQDEISRGSFFVLSTMLSCGIFVAWIVSMALIVATVFLNTYVIDILDPAPELCFIARLLRQDMTYEFWTQINSFTPRNFATPSCSRTLRETIFDLTVLHLICCQRPKLHLLLVSLSLLNCQCTPYMIIINRILQYLILKDQLVYISTTISSSTHNHGGRRYFKNVEILSFRSYVLLYFQLR